MTHVCTIYDDFLHERHLAQAFWTARLSNGQVIYQDDGRPGLAEPSAWLRLGDYVRASRLNIDEVWIRFRKTEKRPLPAKAEGYFFRKSLVGELSTRNNRQFFLIGYLHSGILMVQRWSVPELVLVSTEVRPPDDDRLVGRSLVRNANGLEITAA